MGSHRRDVTTSRLESMEMTHAITLPRIFPVIDPWPHNLLEAKRFRPRPFTNEKEGASLRLRDGQGALSELGARDGAMGFGE